MRTTHRGLAIAVATTVAMLGSTLPAQAVTTYEIRVGSLEEGSTPEVPVLAGGDTIVDGDRRIPVDGYGYPMLLGPAGDSYVVAGVAIGESRMSASLVDPEGSTTRLVSRFDSVELSDDGARLVTSREGRRGSLVRVVDTTTGDVVARRRFAPWTSVLDVTHQRVVTSSWERPRTTLWRYRTDRTRVLRRKPGQFADLSSGVFSVYVGDPYDRGWTAMSRVRAPRRPIWRNRRERVIDISPDGTRMLTTHIVADGPGPVEVTLRRTAGRRIAVFRSSGLFGDHVFEDDRDVLLEAVGRRREAWVRANGRGVERVTRLRPAREV
jgi:hypothetical protein